MDIKAIAADIDRQASPLDAEAARRGRRAPIPDIHVSGKSFPFKEGVGLVVERRRLTYDSRCAGAAAYERRHRGVPVLQASPASFVIGRRPGPDPDRETAPPTAASRDQADDRASTGRDGRKTPSGAHGPTGGTDSDGGEGGLCQERAKRVHGSAPPARRHRVSPIFDR